MSSIRVVLQTNLDGHHEVLRRATGTARKLPGCLHAEDFCSVEFPENVLHLEQWESPATWDAAWSHRRAAADGDDLISVLHTLQAPFHPGLPEAPRRSGQSGVEFYKHASFAPMNSVWTALDDGARANSIRWPAWGAIRIVIQVAGDAPTEPLIHNSLETRREPGCQHFEYFRSVEYPENLALIESWSSPSIYDAHWMARLVQQRTSPAPVPPPFERRYGANGFEWYPECRYTLVGEVWMPEAIERRMSSVWW